jgi:hypothetical protein
MSAYPQQDKNKHLRRYKWFLRMFQKHRDIHSSSLRLQSEQRMFQNCTSDTGHTGRQQYTERSYWKSSKE